MSPIPLGELPSPPEAPCGAIPPAVPASCVDPSALVAAAMDAAGGLAAGVSYLEAYDDSDMGAAIAHQMARCLGPLLTLLRRGDDPP